MIQNDCGEAKNGDFEATKQLKNFEGSGRTRQGDVSNDEANDVLSGIENIFIVYNNRGPYQLAGITVERMRRDHCERSKGQIPSFNIKCDHDVSANASRFMCIRYEYKIK